MAIFARGRFAVNWLTIIWITVTVWYEFVRFAYDVRSCHWPDQGFSTATTKPFHILVIADPQILDHRSYPGRAPLLTYLSRLIVDLNLRKNWWAAKSKKPNAVVFLGDMMDSGRYDMSDEEYEAYYSRFKSIFKLHSEIPQYFVPGNHDTGLGIADYSSPFTRSRYTARFGHLNYDIRAANHTLVFIDAPGYIDEDYQRHGGRESNEAWEPAVGGTIEYMQRFAKGQQTEPVILFSHIPLYRPDGRSCGPLRERGTIQPGVGVGYQNTLGKQASQKLLEIFRPSLAFSGDDHDYCEYNHTLPPSPQSQRSSQAVREVSVKSISMAMGIRRPGFQLLSLAPPELRTNELTHADLPCLLPDQLGIYLNAYIPLLIISVFAIFVSGFFRESRQAINNSGSNDFDVLQASRLTTSNLRARRDMDIEQAQLPQPVSGSVEKNRNPNAWPFTFLGRRRRLVAHAWASPILALLPYLARISLHRTRTRRYGRMVSFLFDVRDVAVYPIGIFVFITWWFS